MCATQAALSVKALWFLTHAAPKQTNHGLEETLKTLRSLRATTDALSFYSFQRSWAKRKRLQPATEPHAVVHLSQGISSVSDTYINAVIDAWYYKDVERCAHSHSAPCLPSLYISSQVFAAVVRATLSTRRRQERPSLQVLVPSP